MPVDSLFTGGAEGGGGVFGGMEVLQCYNPHKTERFCMIGVLQRCYKVLQGATKGGGHERQIEFPGLVGRPLRARECIGTRNTGGSVRALFSAPFRREPKGVMKRITRDATC